ncbi:MAG: GNAT family N-acetyltransferase [Lachnospiraceae bacterium]
MRSRKKRLWLCQSQNNFYSFYDGTSLVGFVNLSEEENEVFFGIGVNPDCCNHGYGQQMTRIACELSQTLFPGKPLYLEVRTWNTRAVRCYEKAGFCITGGTDFAEDVSWGRAFLSDEQRRIKIPSKNFV